MVPVSFEVTVVLARNVSSRNAIGPHNIGQRMQLAHTVLVKDCHWPTQYWSKNAIGPHSLCQGMLLAHTVLVKECNWLVQSWSKHAIGPHSLGQRMLLAHKVSAL